MLIGIFAFLLLAGVAYSNLNEGIYGALIVLILSVIAGAIAMNFYGPMAHFLIVRHLPWAGFGRYAEGVLFLLLYGGSLLALRTFFDHFLTERVRFPVNIDRLGAVAIGVLTGTITVGAFLFACQLMPLNKQFLGYSRRRPVLGVVAPDATYLRLMRYLSKNVLERSAEDPDAWLPLPRDIRDALYDRREGLAEED